MCKTKKPRTENRELKNHLFVIPACFKRESIQWNLGKNNLKIQRTFPIPNSEEHNNSTNECFPQKNLWGEYKILISPHAPFGALWSMKMLYGFPLKACGNDGRGCGGDAGMTGETREWWEGVREWQRRIPDKPEWQTDRNDKRTGMTNGPEWQTEMVTV